MREQITPTKGNLLLTKKYLELSTLGFDLLDRKRNILTRELMQRIGEAKEIKAEVGEIFATAYKALQQANITLGVIDHIADSMPVAGGISIDYRSVMGVELPSVKVEEGSLKPQYALYDTNSRLDYAYVCFLKVRTLSARLAELENSIYRLTYAIQKTQRRANALKNIIIPGFETDRKFITESLEEKEREEFSRLKVIKAAKLKKWKPSGGRKDEKNPAHSGGK